MLFRSAAWDDDLLRQGVLDEVWPDLEKIAIDNAVAEPAALDRRVAVVPATFGACTAHFAAKPP